MGDSGGTKRLRVLLTNDDGRDSPLFTLLVNVLRDYADLSIAVPAQEQSWQGKSMTRHGHVGVEQVDVAGHPAWSIDGTPADCVNIALYNLLETRPDLVVSGINIGVNAGVSLVWASGTVGACLEANIAGIPGIALSQQLSPTVYQYWDQNRSIEPTTLARLDEATRGVMANVWRKPCNRQRARQPCHHLERESAIRHQIPRAGTHLHGPLLVSAVLHRRPRRRLPPPHATF